MATATIAFTGNMGGQIDTSPTPNGTERIRFSVAVNDRRGEQETVAWYRVSAFGSTARGLTTLHQRGSLASGALVYVAGALSPREYQDRAGQTRTSLDVTASAVDLLRGTERGTTEAGGTYDDVGF